MTTTIKKDGLLPVPTGKKCKKIEREQLIVICAYDWLDIAWRESLPVQRIFGY